MLARENRLSGKRNFTELRNKGILTDSDSFGISVVDRGDSEPSRFGFIISTKISPSAATRNKARRALSEGLRHITAYLKPGFNVAFLAKPHIIKKYTGDLMQEVKTACDKAGLLK